MTRGTSCSNVPTAERSHSHYRNEHGECCVIQETVRPLRGRDSCWRVPGVTAVRFAHRRAPRLSSWTASRSFRAGALHPSRSVRYDWEHRNDRSCIADSHATNGCRYETRSPLHPEGGTADGLGTVTLDRNAAGLWTYRHHRPVRLLSSRAQRRSGDANPFSMRHTIAED